MSGAACCVVATIRRLTTGMSDLACCSGMNESESINVVAS